MKNIVISLFASLAFLFSLNASAIELNIAQGGGSQGKMTMELTAEWEKKTGHKVNFLEMPASTSDQYVQYKTWLSAQNSDVDIYKVDNVWAGEFGTQLIDLKPYLDEQLEIMPNVLSAYTTAKGEIIGLPYSVGIPMLYYRTDLLEKYNRDVPETWDEMTETAQFIQDKERAAGNDKMWGFVWQGNAYEGLTCDALEWVASHGGGMIVEKDGTISINNANAAAALDMAAKWVGTISPEGVIGYKEEDARGIWDQGNAVFMRNWPYAWSLSNKDESSVKGKFDVVQLPRGPNGKSTSTMGGWGYAVSKYSEKQEVAIDLVKFLSNRDAQHATIAEYSMPPVYIEIYDNKEHAETYTLLPLLKGPSQALLPRPSAQTSGKWPQVTVAFYTAAHEVITGKKDGTTAVAELETALKKIKGKGW